THFSTFPLSLPLGITDVLADRLSDVLRCGRHDVQHEPAAGISASREVFRSTGQAAFVVIQKFVDSKGEREVAGKAVELADDHNLHFAALNRTKQVRQTLSGLCLLACPTRRWEFSR